MKFQWKRYKIIENHKETIGNLVIPDGFCASMGFLQKSKYSEGINNFRICINLDGVSRGDTNSMAIKSSWGGALFLEILWKH